MKKWELARYLIDAKKSVDTVIFVADNLERLKNISVREVVATSCRIFYINCGVILDQFCAGRKKDLCAKDKTVKQIYYERDKNSAHKDYNYEPPEFSDLEEMITHLKVQINHVRELCGSCLPQNITLDFVSHNPILYRLVNGITFDVEEKIKKLKHPKYNEQNSDEHEEYPVFSDTEDLRSIDEKDRKEFAVIFKEGLNAYEGLQNRQDGCVLANVLHNLNMWCKPNINALKEFETFFEINIDEMHK